MKLNNNQLKYIIKQKEKGESSTKLAFIYKVSVRHINKIYYNYLKYGKTTLYKTGRKPKIIDKNTENLIINIRNNHPLSGPVAIEKYLIKMGIKVSHNIIYKILLKYNMVNEDLNKKDQRKYVKYEREYSNSLWHIDWTDYNKKEKLIIIEDDASRFIVGLGVYEEENIDNTMETLVKAIELYGKPNEIITDHGTQFFSNGKNGIPGDKNKFQQYLDDNGIKHILARIDHPQTNGKLERLNYTIKRLRPYFSTWDEVVYYYNYERRHMSLSIDDRPVVTPSMAYVEKGGKLYEKQ
ncbi:DDE-type integrase/transposase/recombinase [Picrophilus oshimae]|uniref:Transposase InsO and inactivated derivatives n=1 Tax=Picrophilus torridus (strain ATCC 700027 / DSM 9790 / JCM 10055 / NBRC 100828 / KAW 2/3) TaxID=1122961 RepID=A0A8G2L786_PICTO|nr:DDE-type integrase/transposase/recombinase [Picrophilus oshimae]SMD30793.1 Transposase InsO and inactivated derivatives [Picrophilus oshimae DSM 9789]